MFGGTEEGEARELLEVGLELFSLLLCDEMMEGFFEVFLFEEEVADQLVEGGGEEVLRGVFEEVLEGKPEQVGGFGLDALLEVPVAEGKGELFLFFGEFGRDL